MKKRRFSSICVFCASSDRIEKHHFDLAKQLGEELVRRNLTLVYGGGSVGLMGAVSRTVSENNAKITGIIPAFMQEKELAFEEVDQLIVTTTMRERKAEMESRADAFFVLPGGFGTLEEMVEILTLKQLAIHSKPILILNPCGFFDPLLEFFERIFEEKFAGPLYRSFYKVVRTIDEAFGYLDNYSFEPVVNNWHITV